MFRWIFKQILKVMGWEPMPKEDVEKMKNTNRTVCVFSHTSYWDFWIMIFYILSDPNLFGYLNVLVKPQPFKYAGSILRKIGCIPATKVDDKKGGAVERIVKEFDDKPFGSLFLISPKGSILRREWRSGYYHIARALNAELMVVGLDYEKKNVYVSDKISSEQEEPIVREFLFKELANIVPLVTDQEVVEVRPHDPSKVTVTTLDTKTLFRIGFCFSILLWLLI